MMDDRDAARRRRSDGRSMLLHELQTVAVELAAALHHSCGVRPDVSCKAPREQKTASSVGRAAAPFLARPLLGDASDGVVDESSRACLRSALQEKEKKEEEEEEEKAKFTEELAVLPWSQLTPDQRGAVVAWVASKRKRKKKRKKKLPRTSLSRCPRRSHLEVWLLNEPFFSGNLWSVVWL